MAAPGEFFPMQFASAILSLKQQRVQADAQLQELKRSRQVEEQAQASRDFWNRQFQERQLDMQGQSLANQEAQAQANADTQKEVAAARIKMAEQERMDTKEALTIKALSDLARTGSAFVPTNGFSQYYKIRDSLGDGEQFHEVPVPGLGVMVTKLTGDSALEAQKTSEEIKKIQMEQAVAQARILRYQTQNQVDMQKASTLSGKVSLRDTLAAQNALTNARDISVKAALEAENSGDAATAERIRRDPLSIFSKEEQSAYRQLQLIVAASTDSIAKGVLFPDASDPRAIEVAGVGAALDLAHGQRAAAAAGQPAQAANAPAAARVSGQLRSGNTETFVLEIGGTSRTFSNADIERLTALVENSSDLSNPSIQEALAILAAVAQWSQDRAAGVSIFSRNE